MAKEKSPKVPMAMATEPTTANRTGTWRFEKPVFVEQIAPCSEACPVGEDIPSIMAMNDTGAFEDAYHRMLFENPFPGICGRICFHPCEKVCNRGRFDQAVSIKDLEYFIVIRARESKWKIEKPKTRQERQAAVIGAGPAGLACAYFLARLGFMVSVFEENSRMEISNLAQREPQLDMMLLEWEIEQVLSLDIELRLNVPFERGLLNDLETEFDAIYISAEAERFGQSLLDKPVHGLQTNRVSVSAGAKRTYNIMVSRILESDTRLICPSPAEETVSEGSEAKASGLSKTVVRSIASGKLAAMALDISFHDASLDSVQLFVTGGLGAMSMMSYQHKRNSESVYQTCQVVRYSDLNLAHFKKSPRIKPSPSKGVFSRGQAIQSARRCFNCGICTFCQKCFNYCPDLSVVMDAESQYREIDYDHCKGCGICSEECPRGAIAWIKE